MSLDFKRESILFIYLLLPTSLLVEKEKNHIDWDVVTLLDMDERGPFDLPFRSRWLFRREPFGKRKG